MAFIKSLPLDNTLQDYYTAIAFTKQNCYIMNRKIQEYRLLKLMYMD